MSDIENECKNMAISIVFDGIMSTHTHTYIHKHTHTHTYTHIHTYMAKMKLQHSAVLEGCQTIW